MHKLAYSMTVASQLNLPTIKNLERLNVLLESDSYTTAKLVQFGNQGPQHLSTLIDFIERKPDENALLVNDLLKLHWFSQDIGKVLVSDGLKERFGDDSRVVAEQNHLSLDISDWLKVKDDSSYISMLRRISDADNLPLPRSSFVKALSDLDRLVGLDDNALEKLRGFERGRSGLGSWDIAELVKLADSPDGKDAVASLLATSTQPSELKPYRVAALVQLHKVFPPGSEVMNKLLDFERQGLDLHRVSSLIQTNPERNAKLIESNLPDQMPTQFAGYDLIARSSLIERFQQDPEVTQKLLQFEQNGLDFSHLESYLAGKSRERCGSRYRTGA